MIIELAKNKIKSKDKFINHPINVLIGIAISGKAEPSIQIRSLSTAIRQTFPDYVWVGQINKDT